MNLNSERILYFLTVFAAFLTGAAVMTCIIRDPKPRFKPLSHPFTGPFIVIRGNPTGEDIRKMKEMNERLQDAKDVRNGQVYDTDAE